MTRALVAGFGSIGARHARVLIDDLGAEVAVVSRREIGEARYRDIGQAVTDFRPDYVVVANETSAHSAALRALDDAGFAGWILVEKPLCEDMAAVYRPRNADVRVAFNLRFLPVIEALRGIIADEGALTVEVHAGQWLPDWRPGRDYRETVSARLDAAGGVVRDLCHELDTVNSLLGGWQRVAATGGKVSDLEIDTEDAVAVLLECRDCPLVQVHLNYLDRHPVRTILVNTMRSTYQADLNTGSLSRDGTPAEPLDGSIAETYAAEHRAVLAGGGRACTLDEAIDVVALADAIGRATAERRWVERGEVIE